MVDSILVLVAQCIALVAMLLAFILYRKRHPVEKALFRINKIAYHDGRITYYILRRGLFGKWKIIEPIPGVRGYRSKREAEKVLEDHLTSMGIAMSEEEIVKEYGE